MSPEIYNLLQHAGDHSTAARDACSAGMQGTRLPVNVANHLIGLASAIDAFAREIKDCVEKEKQ